MQPTNVTLADLKLNEKKVHHVIVVLVCLLLSKLDLLDKVDFDMINKLVNLVRPLRLPQSKTYCVVGGRREFVFD